MILKLSKFLDYLFSKEVFQKFSRDRSITLRFLFSSFLLFLFDKFSTAMPLRESNDSGRDGK